MSRSLSEQMFKAMLRILTKEGGATSVICAKFGISPSVLKRFFEIQPEAKEMWEISRARYKDHYRKLATKAIEENLTQDEDLRSKQRAAEFVLTHYDDEISKASKTGPSFQQNIRVVISDRTGKEREVDTIDVTGGPVDNDD